ncbi:MAG: exo-alpha-sialidase [Nevskiaceae bacterium]|nr:MAG: exo-alpha-sialidase [Nevskiaceae bacterium]TBR71937.1 MAG: exo-alpha-sialidase [Nevskiaceae bacterium]
MSLRTLWRGGWVLLCCAPIVAAAHAGDMNMEGHMAAADTTAAALGASAAFAADGTLWVATVADGRVVLRHSVDYGKTLSAPVAVAAQRQDIDSFGENHPDVAVGRDGVLYVTWVEKLPQKWASRIWFVRSTDGGRHFSSPIQVHRDTRALTHSFDVLAVDGTGQPVVAWIDARDHVASMKHYKMDDPRAYKGLAVYYTWSADGGRTFAPERKLMDHSCECCRLAAAREPGGSVALFFRGVYGDNIRDHAFAVLPTDGAAPQPQRATFNGWQVAACPEQGPGLAIGADGVRHAVWYEGKGGPHIWYGQLDPGHAPQHVLQIGGPGAGHADVAADGRTVWLTWNQVSAAGYELKLRVSHDGGVNFAAPEALAQSAAAVYSPQLLVRDGRAYVAWNTAEGFRLVAVEPQR